MGFDAILRSGLATAHRITGSLQATVQHERWKSIDGYGLPTYARAIDRTAIVEKTQKLIRTAGGAEVMAKTRLTFLTPLSDLDTGSTITGRQHPTDVRDRITLPDGTTGPILDIEGMTDPTTDRNYFEVIFLG